VAAPTEHIHEAEADIYSPCALGGCINAATVPTIRARAVAGAANNQLASREAGEALAGRGILFAPDYAINAGGMIGAAEEMSKIPGRAITIDRPVEIRLAGIHRRLIEVFNRAYGDRATPEATADRMAQELIGRVASSEGRSPARSAPAL
jgi:leucine dehydrogenase